jgi:hypothetical protein
LSENFIILEAQSTDKSTPREVMRFSNAEEAAISPGGKWVAFRENDEIYSAPIATGQSVYASPLNWQGSPHNPQIHRDNVGANAKLVSENGGHHLWWAGPDTLVYINGKYLNVANLAEGTLTAHEIRIPSPPSRPKGTLALINARLITLSGQGVIERGSLVIRENRIACVGTCATGSADRVLDFEGKSIVPGFVDVHAHHLTSGEIIEQHRSTSASYLAYGVTTVLDPYDFGDSAFRIAELIEAGRMVGPRTFSTGRAFHPISPATGIKDFDEARRQVERLALAGAVSIKNFLQPRRDQRQMLSIAGGQAGMAVTNEGADLYYDLGCVVDGSTGFEHSLMYLPTYDDVAQFFGRSGAVYSPTIVVGGAGIWASDYYQSIGDLWNEPKQQRFTPWRRLLRSLNRTQTDFGEYSFPLFAETVADIKRAGGRIALGGHGEQPGLDTHWEIFSYGTALEPIEALAVASQGGAFLLGLQDDLGSLEVGRLADLVILDSNPLNDIRNTLDITHVMKGGQLFVGDTLDQIWPDEQPYGVPPWYDEAVFRAPELQQAR